MPTRLSRIDQSLLERYPQWRGVVVMMIVLRDHGRSITGHDNELRRAVDGLVGRVNGRFGRSDYCPVQYVKRPLPHEQVQTRRGRTRVSRRRTDLAVTDRHNEAQRPRARRRRADRRALLGRRRQPRHVGARGHQHVRDGVRRVPGRVARGGLREGGRARLLGGDLC